MVGETTRKADRSQKEALTLATKHQQLLHHQQQMSSNKAPHRPQHGRNVASTAGTTTA
jgi:hypothetical protein